MEQFYEYFLSQAFQITFQDDIIVYKHGDRLYIEVTAESQKVKVRPSFAENTSPIPD